MKNSSAKMIPVGTLLVAMYGSIGKLGITGIECCTNQAIAFAKELHGVTTKYMFYYMSMIKPKLISMGKGGTQKNISQSVLKSLRSYFPSWTPAWRNCKPQRKSWRSTVRRCWKRRLRASSPSNGEGATICPHKMIFWVSVSKINLLKIHLAMKMR